MTRQPTSLHKENHFFRGQDPGVAEYQYVLPIDPSSTWSGAIAYVIGDVVSVGSDSFICIKDNTGNTPPDTEFWTDLSGDPNNPSFQNSWTNVADQVPLRFGVTLGQHIFITGSVDGGSIPSVVFTLPENFRPTTGAVSLTFTNLDGSAVYLGRVDTTGDVWITGVGAGGSGAGLQFNVGTYGPLNVGDWLSVETNDDSGSPNSYGLELGDSSAGGIHIIERFASGGGLLIEQADDGPFILLNSHDTSQIQIAATIALSPSNNSETYLTTGWSFIIFDNSNSPIFQVDEDGTITPSGGGGIDFGVANSGTYLDVTTTGLDGDGYGVTLHDTNAAGRIHVVSDNGAIDMETGGGNGFTFNTDSSFPMTNLEIDPGSGVFIGLKTGEAVTINNNAGSPIFQVDEDGTITPSPSGIQFATANSGTYLDVSTTTKGGAATLGVFFHDVAAAGDGGVGIQSDANSIFLEADAGAVQLYSDDVQLILTGTGGGGPTSQLYTPLLDVQGGGLATQPAASSASTLALGSAYQNVLGYDVMLLVVLNITANVSGVILLGVGPTNTPTQQTIATGVTSTGFLTVPIYLPNGYYALLSTTGTITLTIAGQNAMAV